MIVETRNETNLLSFQLKRQSLGFPITALYERKKLPKPFWSYNITNGGTHDVQLPSTS